MKPTIAILPLLLLAALAGCLDPEGASDDQPPGGTDGPDPGTGGQPDGGRPGNGTVSPPTTPGDLLWGGQILEAIDCTRSAHNPFADRAAVEARVPDHLSVQGSGPVALVIQLLDCRSLTIGNGSLQKDAWIYFTYVTVDDGDPATQTHVAYLLEFGSDWGPAWQPLGSRGAHAVGGVFQHAETADADTLTFTAGGIAYTFQDTGSGPMPVPRNPSEILLLAGPDATTAMQLSVHHTSIDNLPVAGALTLEGGVLEELLGPAAPSAATEGTGGATLREIVEDG